MSGTVAELLERRRVLPGEWLDTYHAPAIASASRPGRYVHLRTPARWTVPLLRPFPVSGYDRAHGQLTLHVRRPVPGSDWLERLRPGDRMELIGPLGRGFEVDDRSRHLLLVADGSGMPSVRALADEAIETGRQVVVLLGAPSAASVYPSSLIPEEAEYLVATEDGSLGQHGPVTDLVTEYEAWADQCFASGPVDMLRRLAVQARGRDARLGVARLGRRRRGRGRAVVPSRRQAWLQVLVEQEIGCALGTCLGCVVHGAGGPVRVCREGPAFAIHELGWGEPA
jgi:dihydroorotate dehydrogenase electron transfer subunit